MKGEFRGIQVRPKPNEPIENVIRRFTKVVRNSKILDEWREKQSYDKPSVKRRRKEAIARWRLNKTAIGE